MAYSFAIKVGGNPDPELASTVSSVEVHERLGEATTFRLRYQLQIGDKDLPLLRDGRLDPGSEIQIVSVVDGQADTLVRGPVHAQQIRLVHGGADSYVDVVGADASITMNREVKAKIWDGVKDSDAISTIVGTYALTPDVDDTPAQHEEDKHTLVQRDTDLRFVRRLARRNGMLFWLTADPLGVPTAHCKRPPLDASPGAKLRINVDTPNLNELSIDFDVERPTSSVGMQLDLADKGDLDGSVAKSPQKLLGDKGLADITGDTRSVHVSAPVDDTGDLKARGEGALIEADFFVRARGETSVYALGQLLHAHTVADLQGAGKRHSGPWLVVSVRHLIDGVAHRMEFELTRNGWGA